MRPGRDFAVQGDPARNPHFSRRWAEPPRYSTLKTPKAASAKDLAEHQWRRQCARLRQLGGRSSGEA